MFPSEIYSKNSLKLSPEMYLSMLLNFMISDVSKPFRVPKWSHDLEIVMIVIILEQGTDGQIFNKEIFTTLFTHYQFFF